MMDILAPINNAARRRRPQTSSSSLSKSGKDIVFFVFGGLKLPPKVVTHVIVQSGIRVICRKAFEDCSDLTIIEIPKTVKSIKSEAFHKCKSLLFAKLPYGLKHIHDGVFFECESLMFVDIPPTVECIGEGAFASCTSLIEVNIPEGICRIPGMTFKGCSSLRYVKMPSTVVSIGEFAFADCKNLISIELSAMLDSMASLALWGSNPCLDVPASITNVAAYTYRFCSTHTDARMLSRILPLILKRRLEGLDEEEIYRDNIFVMIQCFEDKRWERPLLSDIPRSGRSYNMYQQIRLILARLELYEEIKKVKPVGPLLELALWKHAIDQGDDPSIDRQACRIQCGAGVVIRNVLPFLYKQEIILEEEGCPCKKAHCERQRRKRRRILLD